MIPGINYLKGEFLDADALSEPGERSVDEVKQSDERNQVGGDVGDQRYGVGSTGGRSLDEIHLRSTVPQRAQYCKSTITDREHGCPIRTSF